MRDVMVDVDRWREQGQSVALATVISTWGSAPRGIGSKMALTSDGNMTGSVSGGCVEGAVYEMGTETIKTGRAQLLHFGVADETAWEVGLACGGKIDVFVNALDADLYDAMHTELVEERSFAVATIVRGPEEQLGHATMLKEDGTIFGTLGDGLDEAVQDVIRAALAEGKSRSHKVAGPDNANGDESAEEQLEVFIEVQMPSPVLIMVGAVHIANALTSIANALGYRTIIVDPRRAFGNRERFPHTDELVLKWPDKALDEIGVTRSTAIATLTHDPKLDNPALKVALPSNAFYVGALGSKRTQAKRRKALIADGMTEEGLSNLYGPIGLDLGGRTPEEIALAIMAEIVAARHNRTAEQVAPKSAVES